MNFFDGTYIDFSRKQVFWLLLLLPLYWTFLYFKHRKRWHNFVSYTKFSFLGKTGDSLRVQTRFLPHILRSLTIACIIFGLAGPEARNSWKNIRAEGIDIMLSVDLSLSMLAKDFKPNRLEVAKEVIAEFIQSRPGDRIGLVAFGGVAFTHCPLTTDHKVLLNILKNLKAGSLEQGTAIGLGLANAVARIKDSESKSKVIILVSDGVNNVGEIAPITAGELAKQFHIRVYCIGVGTMGKALQPVGIYPNGDLEYDYVDVEIDEKVMTEIATMTGGKYFRAKDKNSLKKIYEEIDKMEKTIFNEQSFSKKEEKFFPFVLGAIVFLFLEILLRYTVYRSLADV
jgi:Ca-activated chloride channel family protein